MPTLVIDGHEVTVAPGVKVIEAAERLGIMIPRFCYHPALGAVGACRVCAVNFTEGPVKGVQTSCTTDAADGMVVTTTDEESVDFRRHVIEWLMLNHPHDCPVCDEGGHCLLQDETVSGGHSLRRSLAKKRTYEDQDLGPIIQHEMNRCIHCYRCRRFYQDFAGGRDFGALQIASKVYFGRFQDGTLESPFSGNLADICPTGVFTDKPSRFRGRRWDYQRAPTVCLHCALGCSLTASARYREVVRCEARESPAVNGWFICDRGRHGFHYANLPGRPRAARIEGRDATLPEALADAAQRLRKVSLASGAGSIGVIGPLRGSAEAQAACAWFAGRHGFRGPAFFADGGSLARARVAVSGLSAGHAVSLSDIGRSRCIVAAGVDPLSEAPMLALALRQAWRGGGRVFVLDHRPVALPFPFVRVARAPWGLASALDDIAGGGGPSSPELALAAEALLASPNPVVICGTGPGSEGLAAAASTCARRVAEKTGACGFFPVLSDAGAFTGALLGGDTVSGLLSAIEEEVVRALLVIEADPLFSYPDRARLQKALSRLDFLMVCDHVSSETTALAHVLLPTKNLFEAGGTYVNTEGRALRVAPVHGGGVPVLQTGGGSHPPRVFMRGVPGGDAPSALETLSRLAVALTGEAAPDPLAWCAGKYPALSGLPGAAALPEGARVALPVSPQPPAPCPAPPPPPPGAFMVLPVSATFGTEELSRHSKPLEMLEAPPALLMHAEDAKALGLAPGEKITLTLNRGAVTAPLAVSSGMARGVILCPMHRGLAWQRASAFPVTVPRAAIRRASP